MYSAVYYTPYTPAQMQPPPYSPTTQQPMVYTVSANPQVSFIQPTINTQPTMQYRPEYVQIGHSRIKPHPALAIGLFLLAYYFLLDTLFSLF